MIKPLSDTNLEGATVVGVWPLAIKINEIVEAVNSLLPESEEKQECKCDDSKTNEPDYTHCGHCGVKFGDEDNPELHDINCWRILMSCFQSS